MITKKQRKLIKTLSEDINNIIAKEQGSPQMYATKEIVEMKGEDVVLSGIESDEEINPDEEYLINMPMYHEVNHNRRLVRAFIKSGHDGVCHYLKGIGFKVDENMIKQRL